MTYPEALERLRAANPEHILLRVLALSESEMNWLILTAELEKYEAPSPEVMQTPEDAEPQVGDSVLEDLHRKQATLYGERRKLSNSFHDCSTDAERRDVSEAIQAVQRRIEHVRKQMADYKKIGHVPAEAEKYPVPEDPFKLLALRDSLRSSISRKSRQVRELALKALSDAQHNKSLNEADNKLRELQNHIERVQKAITDRNIQPGRLREG